MAFRSAPYPLAQRLAVMAFCLAAVVGYCEEPSPLAPPDRSSPRAALATFLEAGDALGSSVSREYLPSPSPADFRRLLELAELAVACLDLSEVPPAARPKVGRAAALALYETLSRIPLPASEDIPGPSQWETPAGGEPVRWVIPGTEIALARVENGSRTREFLFTPQTVRDAASFRERVRGLPYSRTVPIAGLDEILVSAGGWMLPYPYIQALPGWLRVPVAGDALWKWIALVLLLGVSVWFLVLVSRFSHRCDGKQRFRAALAQVTLPAVVLLGTPGLAYLTLVQINLHGATGGAIEMMAEAATYLSAAWIAWRLAPVVAEAVIVSPRIPTESIDASLIRIFTRLLGLGVGAALLAMGADRLGIPVYGVVAGFGVGGIAIALAAQTTVENLIGGLSLFADKPFVVGDFCRYGNDEGTIECIGIRSTRVRGLDRTVTAVPNAVLSKMPIVNLTCCDRVLLRSVISVRCETSPDQLRYLLVKIRSMLLGHPRIHPDGLRVRFVGFGACSLDIEVFAYAATMDRLEFLAIREDVFLRIMDIVEQSGSGFAFPSTTLYLGRDQGLDAHRSEAAEAHVRQWRTGGCLPFPDFPPGEQDRRPGQAAGLGTDGTVTADRIVQRQGQQR